MTRSTFTLNPKASISLMSQIAEPQSQAALSVRRMLSAGRRAVDAEDPIKLILETVRTKTVERLFQNLGPRESAERLADGFYSLHINPSRTQRLLDAKEITRIQTKKPSRLHLEAALPEADVFGPGGARLAPETGKGVL